MWRQINIHLNGIEEKWKLFVGGLFYVLSKLCWQKFREGGLQRHMLLGKQMS